MRVTRSILATAIVGGMLMAGTVVRGQEEVPPAPPAPPAPPVAPAPPAQPPDTKESRDEIIRRVTAQARREADEARRQADEARRTLDQQNRNLRLHLSNDRMPLELRGPSVWWGTVGDLSRMSNDPTSVAVAAVLQASDLLKGKGADAEVRYFEDLMPQVTNDTVKRAIRLQLIDAYKRAKNSDRALDELEKLIVAAPATKERRAAPVTSDLAPAKPDAK